MVIGICGGTGSGKTTVVKKIMSLMQGGQVAVLSQDSYYKDNAHVAVEQRAEINFDHPDSVEFDLLCEHLSLLKQGKSVEMPTYSYISCTRQAETIHISPKQVILVEGILILTDKKLRDMCDIKIFVDAPADERLMRVLNRDIIERKRPIETTLERYIKTVRPMHEQFIEPSKKFADIIVPQGGENEVAIAMLASTIRQKLGVLN